MKTEESIRHAWEACRHWLARRDGLTSEIFILDIPEDSTDSLFTAVRDRASIVAVLGTGGLESFTDYQWTPADDDDLILSTFFIAIHEGLRLQHFLSPSKPGDPGPWVAVSRGSLDLEVAFWPDEVFAPAAAAGHERLFSRIVRYTLDLREATGGSSVCLAHGCSEDPRRWLERAGDHPVLTLYP